MKAIGITCGVGSLLIGARSAGFNIIGNIEWRKYYNKPDKDGKVTFLENFPGAFLKEKFLDLTREEMEIATACDLAMGHPECGNFSGLSGSNKNRLDKMQDPGDIPLFIEMVAKLKPRFFVMDDLPKAFVAFPMQKYIELLPGYDLFPEWISNHGYGNIQKHRKRFFMIGALKTEKFVFCPGEIDHSTTVKDIIDNIVDKVGQILNHDPHEMDAPSGRFINMPNNGDRHTWREFRDIIRDYPEGKNFGYQHADGSIKVRIGSCKVRWNGASPVLHGGNPILHPITLVPLTIRERARIQGFPDDFIFYGTRFNDRGEWNHEKNINMEKQTGKAMPIQFAVFVATQIAAHIEGRPFECTEVRLLKPNPFIDEAKKIFCSFVGYSDQERACLHCHQTATCEGPQMELKNEK